MESAMQAIQWSDTNIHLKDIPVAKHSLPTIVKVTKGQYRNIGVSKSVFNELYIHSIQQSQKVMAEGIKIKDNKKIVKNDQNFSLPVSYQGWFEVLSADGKAIKPIPNVKQLLKAFPNHCLVRENTKAFIESPDGDLTGERTRVVHTGEQLKLMGDLNVPIRNGKGGTSKKRLLRCIDENGNNMYFNMDQKGLFSPIAGHGNISGVHNIRGLLEKFRFPILVRLVHGIIPTRLDKPGFAGVFRLTNIYDDETAFVCPLRKDVKMVPISTQEPLKLSVATNFPELRSMDHIRAVHDKCTSMIKSYLNSIHILINTPNSLPPSKSVPDVQRSTSTQNGNKKQSLSPPATLTMAPESTGERVIPKIEEDILFEEVDDIYQYVRQGGAPPPARPRPHEMPHVEKKKKSKRTPITHRPEPIQEQTRTPEKYHDEDYWEEPIYEQLDKFLRKNDTDLVSAGTSVAINTATVESVHQNPSAQSESPATISTTSESSEAISKNSVDLPPVPPKRYESTEVLSQASSSPLNTLDIKSSLENKSTTKSALEVSPLVKEKSSVDNKPTFQALTKKTPDLSKEPKPQQIVRPQISRSLSETPATEHQQYAMPLKRIPKAVVQPNQIASPTSIALEQGHSRTTIPSADSDHPKHFQRSMSTTTVSIAPSSSSNSVKQQVNQPVKQPVKVNPVVIKVGETSKPTAVVTASSVASKPRQQQDSLTNEQLVNSTTDGEVNIKVITRQDTNEPIAPSRRKPRQRSTTVHVVSPTTHGTSATSTTSPSMSTITSTIPPEPKKNFYNNMSNSAPTVNINRITVSSPAGAPAGGRHDNRSSTQVNVDSRKAPFVAVARVGDADDRTTPTDKDPPRRRMHYFIK